jgi:antibiotic biosynthesis monooxygenase (ABM) superfamily enzyme
MKRRACLKAILAGASTNAVAIEAADIARPIQLHLDLAVNPAKEAELLRFFETTFRPAASQQPGYIDLKMLKLSATLRGPAPEGANFQFMLTFTSEELRQKWVASPTHQKLWPTIESMLTSKNYTRLLYEVY